MRCKACGANERAPGRSLCYPCYGRKRRAEAAVIDTGAPRVLFLDIETSPNVVLAWDSQLFHGGIAPGQIKEATRMLCFAAKWHRDPEVHFHAEWQDAGSVGMIEAAHNLLDEADVVVHYYGSSFDIPHLNREFMQAGLTPPRPYKQVDLKKAVARQFRLPSNKLEFVARALGLGGKLKHEGFGLWAKVLEGDEAALLRMQDYNERDTVLLEECYEVLLPWIPGLPNRRLYDDTVSPGCPTCGDGTVYQSGHVYTPGSKFYGYTCASCGSQFRGTSRIGKVNLKGVV